MNLFQRKDVKQKYFEKLVHTYIPDLYRYAYWLSNDKQLVEEVIQESLLIAWREVNRYKNMKSIKSWLFRIVRNENNRMYINKHNDTIETSQAKDSDDENVFVNNNSDVDELRYALNELSSKYREPIILNVMMGFSVEEISTHMGLSTSVVSIRLFRAREKLRKSFNQTTYYPKDKSHNSFHPTFFGYVTSRFGT